MAPLAVEMLSRCVLKNLCLHSGANEPKWISNDVADKASESSAHRVEFRFAILHARSPHHVLDFAVNWKVDCIEHRNTYETNREASIHATEALVLENSMNISHVVCVFNFVLLDLSLYLRARFNDFERIKTCDGRHRRDVA